MVEKEKVKKDPHTPIPTPEDHRRARSPRTGRFDEKGRELVSPLPIEPPLGYVRHESIAEQIRRMVRSEALRLAAQESGMETFEEADDFDIGDDYEPDSPYENDFDPPISQMIRDGQAALDERTRSADTPQKTLQATAGGDSVPPGSGVAGTGGTPAADPPKPKK